MGAVQVVDIQAERGPQRALLQFKPMADANQLKIIVCGCVRRDTDRRQSVCVCMCVGVH